MILCLCNKCFLENYLVQISHLCGFFSVWMRLWIPNSVLVLHTSSHIEHLMTLLPRKNILIEKILQEYSVYVHNCCACMFARVHFPVSISSYSRYKCPFSNVLFFLCSFYTVHSCIRNECMDFFVRRLCSESSWQENSALFGYHNLQILVASISIEIFFFVQSLSQCDLFPVTFVFTVSAPVVLALQFV